MFNLKRDLFQSQLVPYEKVKKKILIVATAMLLPSVLLIDILNVRTGSHETWLTMFIKNIYLMIPWGLVYLIAARYRDLLKIFTPLYMSSILVATTSSLAFNHFSQSNIEKKFQKEVTNIVKDYHTFLADVGSSIEKPSQMYSANEYGYLTDHLNKFKTWIERFKQEERGVVCALNEVQLHKIYTDEVIFSLRSLIEKKKELEAFFLFVDETAKRIEDIHSECVVWGRSLAAVEGEPLKGLATGLYKSSGEKKFLRQESYRILKNIVQEYVKFLSFLSKVYGNYEKVDGQIVFYDENDLQTVSSHFNTIEALVKEQETCLLALCEGVSLITTSSPK